MPLQDLNFATLGGGERLRRLRMGKTTQPISGDFTVSLHRENYAIDMLLWVEHNLKIIR